VEKGQFSLLGRKTGFTARLLIYRLACGRAGPGWSKDFFEVIETGGALLRSPCFVQGYSNREGVAAVRWLLARRWQAFLVAALASIFVLPSAASAAPTFLTAATLSDPGQDGFEPEVAQDGSGNVYAVWTRSDGTNFRVQYSTRTPAGSWSAPVTLSDAGQSASTPEISSDAAGNVLVGWTRSDGTNGRIQAAFKPAGGSFLAPVTVSAAGGDATEPDVSMDAAGKGLLVWQRFDGSFLRIQAAIRSAGAGGSFGVTSTLSAPGQTAFSPRATAGADVDANAAICWSRSDGATPVANLRVQCSRRRDVAGYPRPKAGSPFRISMVPAYNTCGSPNRVHAAPLNFSSCAPPVRSSAVLTTGSPDSNGFAANQNTAAVKYTVINGNDLTEADEADVKITVAVNDVRTNPGGLDYTGQLGVRHELVITDRSNSVEAPEPGTTQTFNFEYPVQCVLTTSTTIGGQCDLNTTADAVLPGMVLEGRRTMWNIGQVQIRDAGPNGTGYASCPPTCGDGDEGTYLRQGVFAP
jgi:hypothetical protein